MQNDNITHNKTLLGFIVDKRDFGHPAEEYILKSSMHFVVPCFPSGKSNTKLLLSFFEQYILILVLLGIPINSSLCEFVHISPSPYSNTMPNFGFLQQLIDYEKSNLNYSGK